MIRSRHLPYVRSVAVIALIALGSGCYSYHTPDGRPPTEARVRADLRPRPGGESAGALRVEGTLIADTGDSLVVEVPPPQGAATFVPGAGGDTVAVAWERVQRLRVHRLDVLRTVGLAAAGIGVTAVAVFGAVDGSSAGSPPQGQDGEPLNTLVGWQISLP